MRLNLSRELSMETLSSVQILRHVASHLISRASQALSPAQFNSVRKVLYLELLSVSKMERRLAAL